MRDAQLPTLLDPCLERDSIAGLPDLGYQGLSRLDSAYKASFNVLNGTELAHDMFRSNSETAETMQNRAFEPASRACSRVDMQGVSVAIQSVKNRLIWRSRLLDSQIRLTARSSGYGG